MLPCHMGHEAAYYLPEQAPTFYPTRHSSSESSHFQPFRDKTLQTLGELVSQPTLVSAPAISNENPTFLCRFERLQPRIEQIVRTKWGAELDPYETDNLVQAAYVHLWMGYERAPEKFDANGDGYWFAAAKRGASNEFVQEFRQRYQQKGTGSSKNRQHVEVVVNSGDMLATIRSDNDEAGSNPNDVDETFLAHGVIYSHDATSFQEIDTRLEVERLIENVYHGTAIQDHPRITRILNWMKEGYSLAEMARREGVKQGTIKCMVRRIRQACGATSTVKENNQHRHHGTSKDEQISRLLSRGIKAPEIARLIGTDHSFVYRRLRALNIVA